LLNLSHYTDLALVRALLAPSLLATTKIHCKCHTNASPPAHLAEVHISHDYKDAGMLRVSDPHLLAIQDPMLAILFGTSLEGKGICPTTGLRQTVASYLKQNKQTNKQTKRQDKVVCVCVQICVELLSYDTWWVVLGAMQSSTVMDKTHAA